MMRRIFSIGFLLLILVLWSVGSACAMTVAAPPTAVVGQNVSMDVSTELINTSTCQMTVNFGDSTPPAIVNCTTPTCTANLNHVYLSSGNYTVAAGSTCVFALTTGLPIFDTDDAPVSVSCPPLNVVTSSLPDGVVGSVYRVQLSTSGGIAPVSWELADLSPPLPDGLALLPRGLISGTPTTYGVSTFTLGAKDDCGIDPNYVIRSFSINIASPATAELTITRMQLSFANGRAETTVNRNQPGLRAVADLRFNGTGLLKGYWEVDGRMLAPVNQHLTYGKSIRLTSPAVPFLPTFVEGTHRVRLVITNPDNEIPFPEAIYYVTSEDSTADLAPLRATEPRNHAELAFASQSFSWDDSETAAVYLVEFFEKGGVEPVAAAYTKEISYDLPESILNESFASGKAYAWRVKSYDAEGSLVGVSELSHFIFQ